MSVLLGGRIRCTVGQDVKKQISIPEVGKLLADKRLLVAGIQVLPIGIGIVQLGVAVGLITMSSGTVNAVISGITAGGAVLVVWVVAAVLTAGKPVGLQLTGKGASEGYGRLLANSEAVAKTLGMALPPIYVDTNEASPNMRTVGLLPSQHAIVITGGLARILADQKQFQAAVAHELVHIQSGDILAQAFLRPVLALLSLLLRLAAMVFFWVRRERARLFTYGMFGMNMAADMMSAMMRPLLGPFGGLAKPLILLFVVSMLFGIPFALVGALFSGPQTNDPMAAAVQVPVLFLVLPLISFAILRYRETQADRMAAKLIGDPSIVAYALGNCIEQVPGEAGLLERFIAANGVANERDLIEKLKTQPIQLRLDERLMELLRSHPYGLKRMAAVVSSQH